MPPTGSRSPEVVRRAAVTVAVALLVLVGERLALPLLEPTGAAALLRGGAAQALSVLALGLTPLLTAFLLVELVARFTPALRPLRHGGAARRARLDQAAWGLGALLALLQGWGIAAYLARVPDAQGFPLLVEGPAAAPIIAVTLAAGALSCGLGATLVTRFGLGNGFAVLLAVKACEELLRAALAMHAQPREAWSEQALLAGLAAAVVIPLVLRRLWRSAPGTGPRVPVPTSGLAVLRGPALLLALPWQAAAWVPALAPLAAALEPGDAAYPWALVALTPPLALLLSRLFTPPVAVVRAWRRALPTEAVEPLAAEVRQAVGQSEARTLVLVTALAFVPIAAGLLGSPVQVGVELLLGLAVVLAVGADLREEARARAADPRLVSCWPLHRVYAAAPVLRALEEAGIPGTVRTARFRALFHFFAPYAPIELLVPEPRAAEAELICARVAADP